jgi:hypothetical protein
MEPDIPLPDSENRIPGLSSAHFKDYVDVSLTVTLARAAADM